MATYNEDLFRYTSGRWLCNEKTEIFVRSKRFDIEALKRIAAKAVGADSSSCNKFEKFAEGSFNRIFLLNFDNGAECLARIPYPIAGPSYLLVSSEVATLEFLRTVLEIPVPKVLAWSSRREPNPVGTDYIIMEKVKGVQLQDRWDTISGKEDFIPLMQDSLKIEQKLFGVRFSQIGSIYFKEDVGPHLQSRPLLRNAHDHIHTSDVEKYRIGPIADWSWWRGTRSKLDIDHGPWPNVQSYLAAAARCEQTYIRSLGTDNTRTFLHPLVSSNQQEHLDALETSMSITPLIVPPDEDITVPTLGHPDLHRGNIIVAEDGPPRIRAIIDWQNATTEPYYLQATFPPAFYYTGKRIKILDEPFPILLPTNFDQLSKDEQDQTLLEQRFVGRHRAYQRSIMTDARRVKAVSLPHCRELCSMATYAVRCWADQLPVLRQNLMLLIDMWEEIVGRDIVCPVVLTDSMREDIEHEVRRMELYQMFLENWCPTMGISPEMHHGWVSTDTFEDITAKLKKAKVDIFNLTYRNNDGTPRFTESFQWPYRDGGYSNLLS